MIWNFTHTYHTTETTQTPHTHQPHIRVTHTDRHNTHQPHTTRTHTTLTPTDSTQTLHTQTTHKPNTHTRTCQLHAQTTHTPTEHTNHIWIFKFFKIFSIFWFDIFLFFPKKIDLGPKRSPANITTMKMKDKRYKNVFDRWLNKPSIECSLLFSILNVSEPNSNFRTKNFNRNFAHITPHTNHTHHTHQPHTRATHERLTRTTRTKHTHKPPTPIKIKKVYFNIFWTHNYTHHTTHTETTHTTNLMFNGKYFAFKKGKWSNISLCIHKMKMTQNNFWRKAAVIKKKNSWVELWVFCSKENCAVEWSPWRRRERGRSVDNYRANVHAYPLTTFGSQLLARVCVKVCHGFACKLQGTLQLLLVVARIWTLCRASEDCLSQVLNQSAACRHTSKTWVLQHHHGTARVCFLSRCCGARRVDQ